MGLAFSFFSVIVSAFAIYIVLPAIIGFCLKLSFRARVRKSGMVCLTFDDGPCPQSTPELLQLLKSHGIKATFFVTGENALRHSALVDRIIAEGHELGEHGHRHLHAWKSEPARYLVDLLSSGRILQPWIGARKALFRPPYGKLNLITLLYAWLGERRLAFWNVDPQDYCVSSNQNGRRIAESLRPGAVVLLHDGRYSRSGSDPESTVHFVATLLETCAHDLRFATLSEALFNEPSKSLLPRKRNSHGKEIRGYRVHAEPLLER